MEQISYASRHTRSRKLRKDSILPFMCTVRYHQVRDNKLWSIFLSSWRKFHLKIALLTNVEEYTSDGVGHHVVRYDDDFRSSHHTIFFFSKNHDFSRFLINFCTVVVVKQTHVVDPKRLTHIHSHRDLNSLSLSTESTYFLVPMP